MTSFSFLSAFTNYFFHEFSITFVASLHRLLHHPLTKSLMALVCQFQVESEGTQHLFHSCSLPSHHQLALSHSLTHPLAQVSRLSHQPRVERSQLRFPPAEHRFPNVRTVLFAIFQRHSHQSLLFQTFALFMCNDDVV